ncbi:hypothetical protein DFH07DRAFT_958297 [Mycena maculata]|uniref:Uncharacterized protein n=1 Tax=Mycena maculata TaxID=230809 RepID=A0AAD7J8L1_9AGAR|nr:hypothetical protein DFH07DRAFT_958297 [Mycena maculata]
MSTPNDHSDMTLAEAKEHLAAVWLALKPKCHLYLPYAVGHTDGESVERGWEHTTAEGLERLVYNTWYKASVGTVEEMGPGTRRDRLDDHFDEDWARVKAAAQSESVSGEIKDGSEKKVT